MHAAMSVEYHGVELWETPPNGSGITALLAANILRDLDVGSMPHGSAAHFHTMIEAIRERSPSIIRSQYCVSGSPF